MEPEAESSASSSEDELDALKPPSWKTRNTAVKIIDITSAGPQCVDLSYIASNGVKNMVEGEIATAKTQDPIEKEQLENCMAENLVQFMKESGTKFPLSSEADTLSTKAEGHVLDNLSQPVSELPHETEVPKKDIGCQTFFPASVSNGHTVGCQTTGTGDIISLNLYYENSPDCKLMTASIHGQNNQTACDNMTLRDFESVLDVLQGASNYIDTNIQHGNM
ncbi:uncharacterized protein [Periplaneta americana]|uniref:uncharacterized protein isoform X2 n=1 Tax=Periplaneta americana TaxID=6978 RepID=UPI0037E8291F